MDSDKSLILIVDDNPENLKVIGNILKQKGHKAAIARDGVQALDFVERKKPGLILMDMMMPEMDGLEACRRLKENESTRDIPVIFITALTDNWNKMKAFEAGGVDYITKPFMKEEVMARVNVHLQLRKTMERLKNMSITDELTGVYNRRFAYEVLERQIKIAKREKQDFTLCYIDIDNLKTINDTHGHKEGDLLIRTVVEALGAAIRKTDYLFRMGGDEFLILFPKSGIEEAGSLLERMEKSLENERIKDTAVEFSYGFSRFHHEDSITADELVKKADSMMYEAKRKKK